ncbi:MAG: response regulator [Candidatus Firestonebacteria bacterium]|nr:response regulator [Candidatus Firestonebacteria bacterium]
MEANKKILIVDDEPYIRSLLEEALEDFIDKGVNILIAPNGEIGLELALQHKPNLIFLDCMMPKMNGYDMCEAIKKTHKLDDIHIIMLTAKGQEIDKQKGLEVGADEYLTKPFDPDEVVNKAAKIFGIVF